MGLGFVSDATNGFRLAKLRKMLAAREGHSEFRENVAAIMAEIARLEGITKA